MEKCVVMFGFGVAFASFLMAFCIDTVWLWGCAIGALIALVGLYFMEE